MCPCPVLTKLRVGTQPVQWQQLKRDLFRYQDAEGLSHDKFFFFSWTNEIWLGTSSNYKDSLGGQRAYNDTKAVCQYSVEHMLIWTKFVSFAGLICKLWNLTQTYEHQLTKTNKQNYSRDAHCPEVSKLKKMEHMNMSSVRFQLETTAAVTFRCSMLDWNCWNLWKCVSLTVWHWLGLVVIALYQ